MKPHTVYDTCLLVLANGMLTGRKRGSLLDKRLGAIERFINGDTIARFNNKLLGEYERKVLTHRNDIIELFFTFLARDGKKVARSSLSRQQHSEARGARWPDHDQHLLAAAIGGTRSLIVTTEKALEICSHSIRSRFGVVVECIR